MNMKKMNMKKIELKDTEASWYQALPDDVICSNCEYSALNDYRGNPVKSKFCPHCGKLMINSDVPEDDYYGR